MGFLEETFADKTLQGVPLLDLRTCVCNKQDIRFMCGVASEQRLSMLSREIMITIRSRGFAFFVFLRVTPEFRLTPLTCSDVLIF
jgi:hypothetical protein